MDHDSLLGIDLINKNSIVIDCGANVGHITKIYAQTGATVYSFEPNPYAYSELQRKFIDSKNVHCFRKGVSDNDGETRLFHHENSLEDEVKWSVGSSMLNTKNNVDSSRYSTITTVNLSQFIKGLNTRVKVVKMDIEGAEYKVICHLIETGAIHLIDYMIVETHENKIPELKVKIESLRQLIKEKKLDHINLDWK